MLGPAGEESWLRRTSSQGHRVPSEGLAFSHLGSAVADPFWRHHRGCCACSSSETLAPGRHRGFPAVTLPGHQTWCHRRIPLLIQRGAMAMGWAYHLGAGENAPQFSDLSNGESYPLHYPHGGTKREEIYEAPWLDPGTEQTHSAPRAHHSVGLTPVDPGFPFPPDCVSK